MCLSNRHHPAAYNNKGVILHHLGRYHEAISNYKRSISLDPQGDGSYYRNLAYSLQHIDQYSEALQYYDKYISLYDDDDDVFVCFNKAYCLEKLGEFKKAFSYYAKTIRLNPGHEKAKERLMIVSHNIRKALGDNVDKE
eukprot:TRINITY_DN11811_c0_g1_i1.p1 TRINITY_DN11811_c0_g1~~TRINITY_DN11811_c0_g1_i1.p1  ORF type:complete len:139 (+),score=23.58 TRINITY_DN11811_c0_g1_i1:2-418(+)